MTQAGYLMRGVPKNVISLTPTQVMKNEVFNDIINILGLQWGEYNSKENLKFNKIIFAKRTGGDNHFSALCFCIIYNCFIISHIWIFLGGG